MKKRLYIAYGSNLNIEQMAIRCPTARIINKGVLKDYELNFRGGMGFGVATVEPRSGSDVPVLLWNIRPGDEKALDIYEGWPHLYRKENKTVLCSGKNLPAMVYIMNEGRPYGTPSVHYLNTIARGYETAGFDLSFLEQSVKRTQLEMEKEALNHSKLWQASRPFSAISFKEWQGYESEFEPWAKESDFNEDEQDDSENEEEINENQLRFLPFGW